MAVEIRTAEEADWPAMTQLAGISFGGFRPVEATDNWRTMMPSDGAVVACDGPDVVGQALYLDLELTVPGGAVLPMAGVSWVAVAPTHRRRGVLTQLYVELHRRMAQSNYPIAGLEASEYGIYGRYGYGAATFEQGMSVDRRTAAFHPEVPDPGGVRLVKPADHRAKIEEIYERWRRRTPGGLHTPERLWDEVFLDREIARGGGSQLIALLHEDGVAMYRIFGAAEVKSVAVTKFIALTPAARVALWRVLVGLDLKDKITVSTHRADPLPYLLTDARLVEFSGEDGLWLRIFDIPKVLQARSYSSDLTAVMDVSDGVLGGGGRFALEVRDGTARCVPTDAAPDVSLDLSVLGSLYLGAHKASSFAFAGRLRGEPTLVAQLDAAFASDVPAQIGYGF